MLHLTGYKKKFNDHLILSVEDLRIPRGIHWFKGANGSGKSTFFRSVAGMIPFSGNIRLQGRDQVAEPVAYRQTVSLSEAEPLYPDYLRGYDLLTFIAEARKAPAGQLKELGARLGAAIYWDKPMGTYSSGMLKKIALLSAFLGAPQLILLDEPLITIDEAAADAVYELIFEKHTLEGVNFLLSSHQDFRLERLPLVNTYLVKDKTIVRE